jgi:hypothetical protein
MAKNAPATDASTMGLVCVLHLRHPQLDLAVADGGSLFLYQVDYEILVIARVLCRLGDSANESVSLRRTCRARPGTLDQLPFLDGDVRNCCLFESF